MLKREGRGPLRFHPQIDPKWEMGEWEALRADLKQKCGNEIAKYGLMLERRGHGAG